MVLWFDVLKRDAIVTAVMLPRGQPLSTRVPADEASVVLNQSTRVTIIVSKEYQPEGLARHSMPDMLGHPHNLMTL